MQATLNLYTTCSTGSCYRVGSCTFNVPGEPADLMAGFTYKL